MKVPEAWWHENHVRGFHQGYLRQNGLISRFIGNRIRGFPTADR